MEHVLNVNECADRISIFKRLTTDELSQSVNEEIFNGLLDEYYDLFVETCNYVQENADKIAYVSCYIDMGVVKFDIEPKI